MMIVSTLCAQRYTQIRKTRKTQRDSGITLSTGMGMGMGMIDVLEITLIVPTLRVGMPPRTLRVRS